mmetsp:Transcript_17827/g.58254  ORF Transcript_17827/g.58254 Transcript_17827/m.58254 type:complete len:207 (-) Transcript_17827:258-878(-)
MDHQRAHRRFIVGVGPRRRRRRCRPGFSNRPVRSRPPAAGGARHPPHPKQALPPCLHDWFHLAGCCAGARAGDAADGAGVGRPLCMSHFRAVWHRLGGAGGGGGLCGHREELCAGEEAVRGAAGCAAVGSEEAGRRRVGDWDWDAGSAGGGSRQGAQPFLGRDGLGYQAELGRQGAGDRAGLPRYSWSEWGGRRVSCMRAPMTCTP